MSDNLALRHSIQLEKLQRRVKKIEEGLDLLDSFQSMQDDIVTEHKRDIDKLKKLVLGTLEQPQKDEQKL